MYRFIAHRVVQAIGTIMVVSIVIFMFVHASGDPAALLVPFDEANLDTIEEMRERLGLNRPLHVQYFTFMVGFWRSDNVKSFRYEEPVLTVVFRGLRWTLVLAGGAMAVGILLAIPLFKLIIFIRLRCSF